MAITDNFIKTVKPKIKAGEKYSGKYWQLNYR